MTDAARSGMIGLGNMGGRIARRIRGGRPRRCPASTSTPRRPRRAGVPTAASLAELVGDVDVVFLSLPDSRVIECVVYGEDGVLASCREGQIVVDLSTAVAELDASASTRDLGGAGRRVRRRRHLGRGGGSRAGHAHDHGRRLGARRSSPSRPFLETFSSRVYHMGAPGSGHVAKLLNNFLNGVSLAAHRRGDGRGAEGRPRPRAVPRRRQPLERRQLRDPQPLPADRQGRLPRGRADEQPDGERRPALPRPDPAARGHEPRRAVLPRRLPPRERARLRRPDQQPGRRRARRHLRAACGSTTGRRSA